MLELVILFSMVKSGSGCSSDVSGIQATEPIHYTGTEVCSYTVSDCMFMSISGTAISFESAQSTIRVIGNTFTKCTNTENEWFVNNACAESVCTSVSGGSMRLYAAKVVISRCCGHMCYSVLHGQFLTAESLESMYLTDISVVLCGRGVETNEQDTMFLVNGTQHIERVNSSFNSVVSDGAAFESSKAVSLDMHDCSLVSSIGRGIISMLWIPTVNAKDNHISSRVNLVNNTVIQGSNLLGLVLFVGHWTLINWIIVNNSHNNIKKHSSWSTITSSITLIDCVSDREITAENCEYIRHSVVNDVSTMTMDHLRTFFCIGGPTMTFTEHNSAIPRRLRYSYVFAYTYTFINS